MKRWSQYFTGAGLNGAALWVVLGYLVIVVLIDLD